MSDFNTLDAIYRVTLVDDQFNEWAGVHASKDEAALAALAAHTAQRANKLWEDKDLSALPMLQTFDGYDDVVEYWQEVEGGCAKWEYHHFGPHSADD